MKANTYLKSSVLAASLFMGASAVASNLNDSAAFTVYATVNPVAEITAQNTVIAFPQVTSGATQGLESKAPICLYSNTGNMTITATSTNTGTLVNSSDSNSLIPYTVGITDQKNSETSFLLDFGMPATADSTIQSTFAEKPCSLGGTVGAKLVVTLGAASDITSGVYSDTLIINVQAM